MSEPENLRIVQEAYAAFGRGDIEGVLERVDEYIEWEPILGAARHVPFAGKRVGKNMVAEFFRILGEHVAFDTFQPETFVAQGDRVVALGRYEGRAKTTGRTFAAQWAMAFRLLNGKVVQFREYVNTSSLEAAFDAAGV